MDFRKLYCLERELHGIFLKIIGAKGSPACVFAFVFVLIYVYFELIMKVIDDDDDDDDFDDDDERKKSKNNNFSSNDRSGHDDQNAY